MSVADYMQLCLGHPQFGYYMRGDVFGSRGDFTTSPEVSQIFGELIGVWCVLALQDVEGNFSLVEGGPGRGTLTNAVLKVLSRFPSVHPRLRAVHLVETSPALRRIQADTLGCKDLVFAGEGETPLVVHGTISQGPCQSVAVHWHTHLEDVPSEEPTPMYLTHELFDALPTHQLSCTGVGSKGGSWREILVDYLPGEGGEEGTLRNALSPSLTPAAAAWESWLNSPTGAAYLALCKSACPNSNWPSRGDVAEVSPIAQSILSSLCKRVRESGGVALIVDYGQLHGARALSLRGISEHRFVDPLASPGLVDLSVDVDFASLKVIAEAEGGCRVLGPIPQGVFLQRLGLNERLGKLIEVIHGGGEQKVGAEAAIERLQSESRRLAHPTEMGSVYKVMAIAPATGGNRAIDTIFS